MAQEDFEHKSEVALSVLLAVQGADPDIIGILRRLPETPNVELLICHASDAPFLADLVPLAKIRRDVRLVESTPNALIPEMWRDGFLMAGSAWVATLTNHCPPDPLWMRQALALVNNQAPNNLAAFGGAIVLDPEADRVGRAVHMLRYANASEKRQRERVNDLSADNAVYRRQPVIACTDLLPDGFWEPNYHSRFLSDGMIMEFVPDLVVTHRNRYSAAEFSEQRRRHGRVFGRQRIEMKPVLIRWITFIASPAAFPIFALKQSLKVLSRRSLRSAMPWAFIPFYRFIANWCIGEIRGYADALFTSPDR